MRKTRENVLDLAEQLFRISLGLQKLNKRLERSMGMSLVQWYVLKRLLEMPGTPAGLLARGIGVHPGTLTPLLKRLRSRGLLYLEKDDLDSRRKTVLITRDGRAKLVIMEKMLGRLIDESCPEVGEYPVEDLINRCLAYQSRGAISE